MRRVFVFISCCFILLNVGCNNVNFKSVNYYSLFDIDVPDDFSNVFVRGSDAQLQLGNYSEEFYLTVFTENIDSLKKNGFDSDISVYSTFCLKPYEILLEAPIVTKISDGNNEVNGLTVESYSISGGYLDTKGEVFYYLSFFKSKDNFYSVLTMCELSSKVKYFEMMKHMHLSFKEQ
jgi:hypothetical protein